MILVDTHVLLWGATDPTHLSRRARSVLREETIAASVVSLYEMAILIRRGRVASTTPLSDLVAATVASGIEILPVTTAIAIHAATLPMHGDPMDRLIVATALEHHIALVTTDGKVREANVVETIW